MVIAIIVIFVIVFRFK